MPRIPYVANITTIHSAHSRHILVFIWVSLAPTNYLKWTENCNYIYLSSVYQKRRHRSWEDLPLTWIQLFYFFEIILCREIFIIENAMKAPSSLGMCSCWVCDPWLCSQHCRTTYSKRGVGTFVVRWRKTLVRWLLHSKASSRWAPRSNSNHRNTERIFRPKSDKRVQDKKKKTANALRSQPHSLIIRTQHKIKLGSLRETSDFTDLC